MANNSTAELIRNFIPTPDISSSEKKPIEMGALQVGERIFRPDIERLSKVVNDTHFSHSTNPLQLKLINNQYRLEGLTLSIDVQTSNGGKFQALNRGEFEGSMPINKTCTFFTVKSGNNYYRFTTPPDHDLIKALEVPPIRSIEIELSNLQENIRIDNLLDGDDKTHIKIKYNHPEQGPVSAIITGVNQFFPFTNSKDETQVDFLPFIIHEGVFDKVYMGESTTLNFRNIDGEIVSLDVLFGWKPLTDDEHFSSTAMMQRPDLNSLLEETPKPRKVEDIIAETTDLESYVVDLTMKQVQDPKFGGLLYGLSADVEGAKELPLLFVGRVVSYILNEILNPRNENLDYFTGDGCNIPLSNTIDFSSFLKKINAVDEYLKKITKDCKLKKMLTMRLVYCANQLTPEQFNEAQKIDEIDSTGELAVEKARNLIFKLGADMKQSTLKDPETRNDGTLNPDNQVISGIDTNSLYALCNKYNILISNIHDPEQVKQAKSLLGSVSEYVIKKNVTIKYGTAKKVLGQEGSHKIWFIKDSTKILEILTKLDLVIKKATNASANRNYN